MRPSRTTTEVPFVSLSVSFSAQWVAPAQTDLQSEKFRYLGGHAEHLGPICHAIEFLSHTLKPSLRRCNPVAVGPRWLMSDVLLMSALEVSDSVAAFIHVKINDLLHHSWHFCLH